VQRLAGCDASGASRLCAEGQSPGANGLRVTRNERAWSGADACTFNTPWLMVERHALGCDEALSGNIQVAKPQALQLARPAPLRCAKASKRKDYCA